MFNFLRLMKVKVSDFIDAVVVELFRRRMVKDSTIISAVTEKFIEESVSNPIRRNKLIQLNDSIGRLIWFMEYFEENKSYSIILQKEIALAKKYISELELMIRGK